MAVPVMALMWVSNTASPVSKEVQANVRFGSKADMCSPKGHVRFTPESDAESAHSNVRYGPGRSPGFEPLKIRIILT